MKITPTCWKTFLFWLLPRKSRRSHIYRFRNYSRDYFPTNQDKLLRLEIIPHLKKIKMKVKKKNENLFLFIFLLQQNRLCYRCSIMMCGNIMHLCMNLLYELCSEMCLVANSEYVNCTDWNLDRDMFLYALILSFWKLEYYYEIFFLFFFFWPFLYDCSLLLYFFLNFLLSCLHLNIGINSCV